MSFPEIEDEQAVRQMLRDKLTTDAQHVNSTVKNQLEDLGLIEVEESRYLICADPDYRISNWHPDRTCREKISFEGRGAVHECDTCGNSLHGVEEDRPVYAKYTFRQRPEEIFDYLKEELSGLQMVEEVEVGGKGALDLDLSSDQQLAVVIPEWAEQQYLMRGPFFSDPTLYVHAGRLRELPTVLEKARHIHLTDLLTSSPNWIAECMETAATPIPDRPSLCELIRQFDEVVKRHVDPNVTLQQGTFFEYFCRDLLNHLIMHPEKMEAYVRTLDRLRGTVYDNMPIQVGGAGNTDIIPVSRYEVMRQLCEGPFIADAKCKLSSNLTMNDVLTVNGHLTTNEWDAEHAVIILVGEKVADNAWNFIAKARRNNGRRWEIMLIPKFALLELIHAVDAKHLLKAVMDRDRTDLFYPGDERYDEIAASRA